MLSLHFLGGVWHIEFVVPVRGEFAQVLDNSRKNFDDFVDLPMCVIHLEDIARRMAGVQWYSARLLIYLSN